MDDLKKLMTNINKAANAIQKGNRIGCANCIIIERTNPHYDDMKKILEQRNK